MGQQSVEKIDTLAETCIELKQTASKKLKYYKDLLEKSQVKQGRDDSMMNDKLAELIDELYLFDRDLAEVENKVTDHKKKRGEARKHIEELDKAPD